MEMMIVDDVENGQQIDICGERLRERCMVGNFVFCWREICERKLERKEWGVILLVVQDCQGFVCVCVQLVDWFGLMWRRIESCVLGQNGLCWFLFVMWVVLS